MRKLDLATATDILAKLYQRQIERQIQTDCPVYGLLARSQPKGLGLLPVKPYQEETPNVV